MKRLLAAMLAVACVPLLFAAEASGSTPTSITDVEFSTYGTPGFAWTCPNDMGNLNATATLNASLPQSNSSKPNGDVTGQFTYRVRMNGATIATVTASSAKNTASFYGNQINFDLTCPTVRSLLHQGFGLGPKHTFTLQPISASWSQYGTSHTIAVNNATATLGWYQLTRPQLAPPTLNAARTAYMMKGHLQVLTKTADGIMWKNWNRAGIALKETHNPCKSVMASTTTNANGGFTFTLNKKAVDQSDWPPRISWSSIAGKASFGSAYQPTLGKSWTPTWWYGGC